MRRLRGSSIKLCANRKLALPPFQLQRLNQEIQFWRAAQWIGF